jgi:CHAT domain-containing protein
MADASVLHVATHAVWNPANPLASAIVLRGSRLLRLAEIRGLDLRARLAVLSACNTALVGDRVPDEVMGFPATLMQLGVAGVIATGWPIADAAAFVCVARFLDEWRPGVAAAAALLRTQRWMAAATVRDLTNYVHRLHAQGVVSDEDAKLACETIRDRWVPRVRYWGAFTYTGM